MYKSLSTIRNELMEIEKERFLALWDLTAEILTSDEVYKITVELKDGSEIMCDKYDISGALVRLYIDDTYIATIELSNIEDVY